MSKPSKGYCNQCGAAVPAEYVSRAGQVYFTKACRDCGPTESLVSSDAAAWQAKRDLWQVVPERQAIDCSLGCDRCGVEHSPVLLFMDVTNRCNMDCPICGFSLRGMGFEFDPPLEYFEKIFQTVSQMHPRPAVNLFGGEPTVRQDMFEIIDMGRRYGLEMQITTNGLRLADEDYCRRLCEARVGLRLSFDGRDRSIYERLRGNGGIYERKMQALANLKKFSRRKHTIIACGAIGINDQFMGDLIQFCFENREIVSELGIIPLYENWQPGDFEISRRTTAEDVERMVRDAVPGGGVAFIPAGMTHWLAVMRPFFRTSSGLGVLSFAGVHPNCESVTFLIPSGESYRGLDHYLTSPLTVAAGELAELVRQIEPRLARLDPRKRIERLRGQWLCLRTVLPWLLRTMDRRAIFGPSPLAGALHTVARLWQRRRTKRRTGRPSPASYLRLAVLPFEERHSIDSERLKGCRVSMPYENTDTSRIEFIPHCVWYPYRNDLLRKIAAKYGSAREARRPASPLLRKAG